MRYKITLSYNGSKFCGWQIQNNADTVQGALEKAFALLSGTLVNITGAGRTDTGVNAINYVAHAELPEDAAKNPAHIRYKLNAILPKEIVIHEISEAGPCFHARFDAVSREYHYFVHLRKDPFCENFSYRLRYPVDMERMNKGASYLAGTHDFSCFEKTGGSNKTSICTITHAEWKTYSPVHVQVLGYPDSGGDYMVFTIKADRFLRNMVRAIVGSLLEIGRGRKEPEWIKELILGGNRSDAGGSVPGNALFFSGAEYAGQPEGHSAEEKK
ncbi:MAG: tRNA pseudouridine(38-40) synthase TruA [Bacteroidales bacterium]|nr:tRNA pseudouridine(38-40) synthase TruA [Bacteroidales bacterium]